MNVADTGKQGSAPDDRRRPIGYWLKHLDRLIEAAFERALAGERLTRRHWQTLSTLRGRPATLSGLAEELAPFLADDPHGHRPVVDDLVSRRWVERDDDDRLRLTAAGSDAHAALLARIGATRQTLALGVTEEEYRTVIDVLQRMASNLEQEAR